ncbi:MAG: archaetidylserine decarboxylase [Gammaproteobacteria bacterium]|nr:archaetidylserine decarboxylase [Gammaproteobacteria bacterium]
MELLEYKKQSIHEFKHFNDFFTREFQDDARPIMAGKDNIVSPVDGKVIEFGNIEGQELIQIKNSKYNLNELLNFNSKNIQTYKDGSYITIYLAPYNYHRVHMPVDGMLLENTIIPGELHPVNEKALKSIPDLYSRNQRMVSFFQNANYEFSMIMVAALNVADINKKWSNAEIARQPVSIKQGEEYSRFNLGSTVLMIFPKECNLQWRDNLNKNQNIQLGQLLSTLNK